MLIRIRDFKGQAPRRADKLLGENAAVVAKNVDLRSGRLVPWRDMLRMDTPTKVGTILSIYRWNSRTGVDKSGRITAITQANPAVVTTEDAHGLITGDRVYVYRVAGMTQVNAIVFDITVLSTTTFSLDGIDSSAYGAYTDNGIWVFENGRFFHWITDVDVERAHIGQDTAERTVFTGDGVPKITDSGIATGGTDYPVNDYDLGIPAPAVAAEIQPVVVSMDVDDIQYGPHLPYSSIHNKINFIKSVDHGLDSGDKVLFLTAPGAEHLVNNEYVVDIPNGSVTDASNTNPVVITTDVDLPIKETVEIPAFFDDGVNVEIAEVAGMTSINGKHAITLPQTTITVITRSGTVPDQIATITAAGHGLTTGDRVAIYAGTLFVTQEPTLGIPGDVIVLNANQFTMKNTWPVYRAGSYFLNARKFTIPVDGTALPSFDYGGFWDLSDWFGLTGTEGLGTEGTITDISIANPAVVSSVGHGLETGESVFILGVFDVGELNSLPTWHAGASYTITNIDGDSFSLDGIDSTGASHTYYLAHWSKAYTGGGTWIKFWAAEDTVSKAYVYTYISGWGEEGPPSPVSNILDVGNEQDVSLAGMSVAPGGSFNIVTKRIYRVLSGTVGEEYRIVADIAVATSTYTDAVRDEDLGEKIPSETWIQPPTGMHSIRSMDNGIMVGVANNDIYFTEPFRPHAWPEEYRQAAPHNIITAGAFGNTVVVLTESGPVLYMGSSPGAMSSSNLRVAQVCVSKRGLVELGTYGIIYPSPDGLISLSISGLNIITKDHLTNKEWEEYNPSSIHAYLWDDRYVGFYTKLDGTQGGFIFDPKQPDIGLTFISVYATAGYNDPISDTLFLQVGDNIEAWAKGDSKMTYQWRSKPFEAVRKTKYTVGQVIADDYNDIYMKIYRDGALHHAQNVVSDKPFRFKTGTRGREWIIEFIGTSVVTSGAIAETVKELGRID